MMKGNDDGENNISLSIGKMGEKKRKRERKGISFQFLCCTATLLLFYLTKFLSVCVVRRRGPAPESQLILLTTRIDKLVCLLQGSHGHGNSGKVMEIKNVISRLGKVMGFCKFNESFGKVMEFQYVFDTTTAFC
ncbi:hypothetical protein NL108_017810 [Boleophthalmus pectinirostris]|nr:hypothetical protein NL108_017810 [Boleophthalmus pectinirostris]